VNLTNVHAYNSSKVALFFDPVLNYITADLRLSNVKSERSDFDVVVIQGIGRVDIFTTAPNVFSQGLMDVYGNHSEHYFNLTSYLKLPTKSDYGCMDPIQYSTAHCDNSAALDLGLEITLGIICGCVFGLGISMVHRNFVKRHAPSAAEAE